MLQQYTIPQGGRQVDAKANFLRFESAVAGGADESVRVKADGLDLGTYLPGDAISLPQPAKRWEIIPVTGTATAVVRLGLGQVQSARLIGNVRIIDSSVDKTMAGRQFIGSASQNASAGQIAVAALLANGAASVAIKRLIVSSAVAGSVMIFRATAPGTATVPGGQPNLQNKRMGASVSTCQAANGYGAALPLTAGEAPGYATFILVPLQANQPVEVPLTTPLVIMGTQVLGFAHMTANAGVSATLDVEES